MGGLIGWRFISFIILLVSMLFRAFYSLYLYSYIQHGDVYSGIFSGVVSSGVVREYLVIFIHWVPLNLLFVLGNVFMYLSSLMIRISGCGLEGVCCLRYCLVILMFFCLVFLLDYEG